jgi:hypothetical protein
MVFLMTVQMGTVFYARAVASTAARQGLDAARVADGSDAAAVAAARQFMGHAHAGLRRPRIAVERTSDEVTVEVTGDVLSMVPGWHPTVTATATAHLEEVAS